MVEQIDVAKDVSVALLSTSALLLTLILAFVSPSASATIKIFILITTLFLFASVSFGAMTLIMIAVSSRDATQLSFGPTVAIYLQYGAFLGGLAGIASSIVLTIHL